MVCPPIGKRFCYFDDEFLQKKWGKYDLDCVLLPDFLGYWILNQVQQRFDWYFGDIGGIGFKSGHQSRAAKIQPFVYLHQCSLQQ